MKYLIPLSILLCIFLSANAFGDEPRINNLFTSANKQFELTSYELNRSTFNAETGELVKKEKYKMLADGGVLVFGTVRSITKDEFEVKVRCSIYGPIENGTLLRFTSDKYRWEGNGFDESLVLNKGKLVEKIGVYFNNCEDPVK